MPRFELGTSSLPRNINKGLIPYIFSMPKKGAGFQNLMINEERVILDDWISSRAANGTAERTQAKQRHIAYKIIAVLHDNNTTLDTAQGKDFAKAAAVISNKVTQNSRQSIISQLKNMVKFIQKSRTIEDADSIMEDVKAGSPSKQNKGVLTHSVWESVLNAPMSSKERAYLAVLYDGYHRPYEPYILKWSHLTINESGAIEYKITFKTGIERIIVQKPETTAILEMWRKESGHNYGDDAYIFPDNNGKQYSTLMQAIKLCKRLQKHLKLTELKPSSIRNTAITHDVQAGLPLAYICMRAWGEPYNGMINIYAKANSSQMQVDQHAKNGHAAVPVVEEKPRIIKSLRECPACKKRNAMDGSFCIYCGANLDGQAVGIVATLRQNNEDLKSRLEFLESDKQALTNDLSKMTEDEKIKLATDLFERMKKIQDSMSQPKEVWEKTPNTSLS
jgi:site-specific recombinase XerC